MLTCIVTLLIFPFDCFSYLDFPPKIDALGENEQAADDQSHENENSSCTDPAVEQSDVCINACVVGSSADSNNSTYSRMLTCYFSVRV
jgi:hypothetical protein